MVNKQVKSGKNKVDTDTRQTQVIHEYLQFNIGHSFILFLINITSFHSQQADQNLY